MKISEVSRETGLSSSAIRFYESQGLIRGVRKDKQGIRDFSSEDLKWLKFLAAIKNTRLSISEMMGYAELYYSRNENIGDRLAVTLKYKEKLLGEMEELQKGIDFLDCKIAFYQRLIEEGE